MKIFRRLLILCAGTLLSLNSAEASFIVAPNANTNVEGNIFGDGGFGIAVGVAARYQQVFDATEFLTLPSTPQYITQISFRMDGVNGSIFSHTFPHIQINLSSSPNAADGLSTTLDNNVGSDDTLVFDGPLTLSSTFSGPANGPKTFDVTIDLTTPFSYGPPFTGHLLLDIRNLGGAGTGFTTGLPNFDGVGLGFDPISIVRTSQVGVGDPLPTTGNVGTGGVVARFTFQDAATFAVPEPASISLATLGLIMALASFSWRKRRLPRLGS